MRLRVRDTVIDVTADAPLIMGILNIGPDSVADATVRASADAHVAAGLRMRAAGARIVDVGFQSGRTDTAIAAESVEIDALVPVVSALASRGVLVSVETWRPAVAEAVLDAGAAAINDVSGLADPQLAELVARFRCGLVVMHTRARPKEARFPDYADVMRDVLALLSERLDRAVACGVSREQLIVDPGLDYAKTPEQSIAVLQRLVELHRLDRPILLAVSRKYFIGMLTGRAPADRLLGTMAAVGFGVRRGGAHIVRVHDVVEAVEYLRVLRVLDGDAPLRLVGSPDDESLKWLPPKGAAAVRAAEA